MADVLVTGKCEFYGANYICIEFAHLGDCAWLLSYPLIAAYTFPELNPRALEQFVSQKVQQNSV